MNQAKMSQPQGHVSPTYRDSNTSKQKKMKFTHLKRSCGHWKKNSSRILHLCPAQLAQPAEGHRMAPSHSQCSSLTVCYPPMDFCPHNLEKHWNAINTWNIWGKLYSKAFLLHSLKTAFRTVCIYRFWQSSSCLFWNMLFLKPCISEMGRDRRQG